MDEEACDNNATGQQAANPNNRTNATTPPTTQWEATPGDAHAYASGNAPTNPKFTTKWHQKSPVLGQLVSALMTKKSTLKWQAKSPASGQPSAPMAGKSTLEWQTMTPALARQSLQIAPLKGPNGPTHPCCLSKRGHLTVQSDRYHPSHHVNSPTTANPPPNSPSNS